VKEERERFWFRQSLNPRRCIAAAPGVHLAGDRWFSGFDFPLQPPEGVCNGLTRGLALVDRNDSGVPHLETSIVSSDLTICAPGSKPDALPSDGTPRESSVREIPIRKRDENIQPQCRMRNPEQSPKESISTCVLRTSR
jgi:hypothetical protein